MEINWKALLIKLQCTPTNIKHFNTEREIAIAYDLPPQKLCLNFVFDKSDHTVAIGSFSIENGEVDLDSEIKVEISMQEARLLRDLLNRPEVSAYLDEA